MTKEQEALLEATAKWLWKDKYPKGTEWEQLFENYDSNKEKFRQKAASLLTVQQAAGARLLDKDQTTASSILHS